MHVMAYANFALFLGLHQIFQTVRHLGRNNHITFFDVGQKVGSLHDISKADEEVK
jgi:hypothetical protein